MRFFTSQVTMDNLNDNINLEFLSNKLQKFGEWDSLAIDYHPVTKKHLGLARVMFKLVGSAVACVAALHGRSMMGKQVGGDNFIQNVISRSRSIVTWIPEGRWPQRCLKN